MATISERPSKDGKIRYLVRVRVRGHPPRTATFRRKRDATRWAQKTESEIRERRHFGSAEARRHTVAEMLDRYEDTASTLAPSTWRRRAPRIKWWRERIGTLLLSDLTPAVVAAWRDRLAAGDGISGQKLSPASQNRYLAALSKVCTIAVKEWQWLDTNPVRNVIRRREGPGRMRILSEAERKRLLEACRDNPKLYLLVVLAISTGARQGELMRLTWGDVDLKRGRVRFEQTKNREPRSVPLPGFALRLLKERAAEPVRRIDGRLFAGDFPRRAWDSVREKTKLTDVRFHDLRHSAASYLAMSGATLAELAEILGHKTLQMVKRYTHFTEAHTRAVLERSSRGIFGE
jgi:integrase